MSHEASSDSRELGAQWISALASIKGSSWGVSLGSCDTPITILVPYSQTLLWYHIPHLGQSINYKWVGKEFKFLARCQMHTQLDTGGVHEVSTCDFPPR